jgi:hypothetical protein
LDVKKEIKNQIKKQRGNHMRGGISPDTQNGLYL